MTNRKCVHCHGHSLSMSHGPLSPALSYHAMGDAKEADSMLALRRQRRGCGQETYLENRSRTGTHVGYVVVPTSEMQSRCE